MLNVERLKNFFLELASIASPSRCEGAVAAYLEEKFSSLGARCHFDNSSSKTGSEVGNLIVDLWPEKGPPLLFLAAHMDTVQPADNPKVIFENGVFRSDGRTVLGADDKSALAIFLELAHHLVEEKLFWPVQFVCTTCEEIGLLGAKHLDYSLLRAPFGYALDSEDPHDLINRAPEAIRFSIRVLGRAAHAGLNPEKGINAIRVAAEALVKIDLGRLDSETTANVGLIKGGQATNIVPEEVLLEGEIRSHSHEKLEACWEKITKSFEKVAHQWQKPGDTRPRVSCTRHEDYPLMAVPEGHPVVQNAFKAGEALGHLLRLTKTGGGSDANIFNARGFPCVILGTGMRKVHSTEEYLPLEDFVRACELTFELLRQAAG
ncbi:MAG: M20/M25/M40 family metallo-hydrolase [Thermodesulfobacteria bacterium]|nr:M20/M25/M40 family metallo-hydrolase [Thermodesulfobacteriota bacterium]